MSVLKMSFMASFVVAAIFLQNYKLLALDVSKINETYHNHSGLTPAKASGSFSVKRGLHECYIGFRCPDVWRDAVKICNGKTNFLSFNYKQKEYWNDNGFHMCLFKEAQKKISDPITTCPPFLLNEHYKFDLLIDHYHTMCVDDDTSMAYSFPRIYINRTVLNKQGSPKNVENLFYPLTYLTVTQKIDEKWEECSHSAHITVFKKIDDKMHKVFRYSQEPDCQKILHDWYGAIFSDCVKKFPIKGYENLCLKKEADEYMTQRHDIYEKLYKERH